MQDKELYQQILGLALPWSVDSVKLDLDAGEIVVKVDYPRGTKFCCPECKNELPCFDHSEKSMVPAMLAKEMDMQEMIQDKKVMAMVEKNAMAKDSADAKMMMSDDKMKMDNEAIMKDKEKMKGMMKESIVRQMVAKPEMMKPEKKWEILSTANRVGFFANSEIANGAVAFASEPCSDSRQK